MILLVSDSRVKSDRLLDMAVLARATFYPSGKPFSLSASYNCAGPNSTSLSPSRTRSESKACLLNRVFKSYDDILDHCCDALNKLVDQPWRIMSIGLRDWAHGF